MCDYALGFSGFGFCLAMTASRSWNVSLSSSHSRLVYYTYDFGENWVHRLMVSDVQPGEPGGACPLDPSIVAKTLFPGGEARGTKELVRT